MKKEYLLLIAVIIGLCAYLALKQDDRINYDLPTLASVDTAALDQILITKGQAPLTLTKGEEGWTIADQAYPVEDAAVDNLLDTLKDLRLSALVSESGDLVRYELDPDNALHVKAMEKGKVVREVFIGKTAPSFNHTFVMLKDDNRVFQADGSFRNDFGKSVDEFRDKVVLKFKSGDIKKMTLEKEGITQTLTLTAPEEDKSQTDETAEQEKPAARWMLPGGETADQTAVQDLLASLSRLECTGFKTDEQTQALNAAAPSFKISLENGTTFRVNLFPSKEGEDVAGTSSATPYAFDLASYKASDILSYVDKLLGIKTEETTADKK